MTQVQTMTHPELNRTLAELMGYTVRKSAYCYQLIKGPSYGQWQAEEARAWADAPDYAGDPAASLEVQTKAVEVDHKNYIMNLTEIVGAQHPTLDLYIAALLTAKPRQRAEAAYITLQGARDDNS